MSIKLSKEDILFAGLAVSKGVTHSPVQVQKLFFLIDKNVAKDIGGPFFDFQAYNYGPFDKEIYKLLQVFSTRGYIEIIRENTWREYRLTKEGQDLGEKILRRIPAEINNYLEKISKFVLSLSFSELVMAIYKEFPEMRKNSVFQE